MHAMPPTIGCSFQLSSLFGKKQPICNGVQIPFKDEWRLR